MVLESDRGTHQYEEGKAKIKCCEVRYRTLVAVLGIKTNT